MTQVERRYFLMAAGSLIGVALTGQARAVNKVHRIGALWPNSSKEGPNQAFLQQLKTLGFEEGRNLTIESLYAEWKPARFTELAQELLRRKPELIFAPTRGAAEAAKKATSTVPIVFALAPDPVAAGLVASLARPGGNVTGCTNIQTDLTGKRMQLLQEAVPSLAKLAMIYDPADKVATDQVKEAHGSAAKLGIQLLAYEANKANEYRLAFDNLAKERAQAVFVAGSLASYNLARTIASLALKHRVATMNTDRRYVEEGGLMSYGVDLAALMRRAAHYVVRILHGARPADLPVEQVDRYETLINAKTARVLGLSIPQSVLLRADRVVE